MSAATAAVIVLGADWGFTVGTAAWFADRWLTRKHANGTPEPGAPEQAARLPAATLPHPLPAQFPQRQAAYNRLVGEGKTSAEAGAELGITAPRTLRDYEARRVAMLTAQNGTPL